MLRKEDDIKLTFSEYRFCIKTGRKRNEEAIRLGCKDKHGGKGLRIHIEGVVGEVVVCKHQRKKKANILINAFRKMPDLPPDIEVKTRSKSHYDLIIRDDDDLSRKFVLVVKNGRFWNVVGWCRGTMVIGHESWREKYGDREEAWFVPQRYLKKINRPKFVPS